MSPASPAGPDDVETARPYRPRTVFPAACAQEAFCTRRRRRAKIVRLHRQRFVECHRPLTRPTGAVINVEMFVSHHDRNIVPERAFRMPDGLDRHGEREVKTRVSATIDRSYPLTLPLRKGYGQLTRFDTAFFRKGFQIVLLSSSTTRHAGLPMNGTVYLARAAAPTLRMTSCGAQPMVEFARLP